MDIVVLLKQVPDLVEELEIAPSGRAIDRDRTRFVVSEPDTHALEEAVLLKERHGGTVTAVTLDLGEADNVLFTAIAHGADKAIKITGDFPESLESHHVARAVSSVLKGLKYDLVLTGSEAMDDLDGQPGALLAGLTGLPYVSVVNRVQVEGPEKLLLSKELPGGMLMQLEARLPAVIGIQSAEQPPRYIPVSKVRQVMRSSSIETKTSDVQFASTIGVNRISKPELSGKATLLEGGPDEVADRLLQVLQEKGVLR